MADTPGEFGPNQLAKSIVDQAAADKEDPAPEDEAEPLKPARYSS